MDSYHIRPSVGGLLCCDGSKGWRLTTRAEVESKLGGIFIHYQSIVGPYLEYSAHAQPDLQKDADCLEQMRDYP